MLATKSQDLGLETSIILLYGNQSLEDIAFMEELQEMEKKKQEKIARLEDEMKKMKGKSKPRPFMD
jgi:ferredoxin-NADP reductase